MIDTRYIHDLLAILKLHNVKHVKMQGLELSFHEQEKGQDISIAGLKPEPSSPGVSSVDEIADTLRKQEESLPPDLRADALMDQDKILNWSSPDQKPFEEEPELPLTGEAPL